MSKDVKIFTAYEFSRNPAPIWRAADIDGKVILNNDRYADTVFELTARERRAKEEEPKDE